MVYIFLAFRYFLAYLPALLLTFCFFYRIKKGKSKLCSNVPFSFLPLPGRMEARSEWAEACLIFPFAHFALVLGQSDKPNERY